MNLADKIMVKFRHTYRNTRRAVEIVGVLAKYGLGYAFDLSAVSRWLKVGKRFFSRGKITEEEIRKLTGPQRLRLALSELGPSFIKLGQILSVRPDLIPSEYTDELAKLQDSAPPFGFDRVEKTVISEFGKTINELYREFDPRPVAAASLSQVHRAVLPDGQAVAVKIKRPSADRSLRTDLAVLADLARFIEKRWTGSELYQPVEIVRELEWIVSDELDFNREARNIDGFYANFKNDENIVIPRVFWEITGKNVLTMGYIEGRKLSDAVKADDPLFDRKLLAKRLADAVFKQIFRDGLFHGDPHPGNIFVLENNRLAFLDFGMAGHLDKELQGILSDYLLAVFDNDPERIIRVYGALDIIRADTDRRGLKRELRRFLDQYYGLPLKELRIGGIMEALMGLVAEYKLRLPPTFILLGKAMATIEGIARDLDPDFNVIEEIKPFAKKLLRRKYSPEMVLGRGSGLAQEYLAMFEKAPEEAAGLVRSLKQGELAIGIKLKEVADIMQGIDRASNRLTFGIITAALIVGSSLVIQSRIGPFLFGYSFIGIVGFLGAGILGLGLLVSIIRRGRL